MLSVINSMTTDEYSVKSLTVFAFDITILFNMPPGYLIEFYN